MWTAFIWLRIWPSNEYFCSKKRTVSWLTKRSSASQARLRSIELRRVVPNRNNLVSLIELMSQGTTKICVYETINNTKHRATAVGMIAVTWNTNKHKGFLTSVNLLPNYLTATYDDEDENTALAWRTSSGGYRKANAWFPFKTLRYCWSV